MRKYLKILPTQVQNSAKYQKIINRFLAQKIGQVFVLATYSVSNLGERYFILHMTFYFEKKINKN